MARQKGEPVVASQICALRQQGYTVGQIVEQIGSNRRYTYRVCQIYKSAKRDAVLLEVHQMCTQIMDELREIRANQPRIRKRPVKQPEATLPGDSEGKVVEYDAGDEAAYEMISHML